MAGTDDQTKVEALKSLGKVPSSSATVVTIEPSSHTAKSSLIQISKSPLMYLRSMSSDS